MAWGSALMSAGKAAWANSLSRGMMIGAGVGAAYGAMSDRTSIFSGAAHGAILGRYGYRGVTGALNASRIGGQSLRSSIMGGGRGMFRQLASDFGMAKTIANNGFNKFRAMGR